MRLFYREAVPSPDVAHIIFSFWEFQTGEFDGVFQHEVFPDGCVSLFFRKSPQPGLSGLAFSGLYLKVITAPVLQNEVFWGMRIAPAACGSVVSADPCLFLENRIIDPDFSPILTAGLEAMLAECTNFGEAIAVFEERIRSIGLAPETIDVVVAAAAAVIEDCGGEVKIGDLARHIGISPRQLERRFKAASGLTPKQFARTRRLRAASVHIVEQGSASWAERAAATGFSDQSHLAREFASVTKRTPNSYARKVNIITHGHLVKKSE
ncbi:MAG: AraC family transcriptional regulator [Acidobacteria bacterium]|nr:AraC family transcriptional regulator [Acidobacteriota bacterium]